LKSIVDNLLAMGRMEGGRLLLDTCPTDIGQLATTLVETFQIQAAAHPCACEFPATPLVAAVEARQIEQVLHNLLSNAVKYSREGGAITVSGRREGQEIVVCVGDEGIGIPASEQERIFERFYRVDNRSTRHVSGAGLGLAVSRGIIQAHGGRIWVESAPRKGSSFCFTVPLADP
jgi:signal transduction histidine kinase